MRQDWSLDQRFVVVFEPVVSELIRAGKEFLSGNPVKFEYLLNHQLDTRSIRRTIQSNTVHTNIISNQVMGYLMS